MNAPSKGLSTSVKLWFALDGVMALAPPLYWAANGRTGTILGVPAALAYFLVVGLCISSSVVFAYLDERLVLEGRL